MEATIRPEGDYKMRGLETPLALQVRILPSLLG